MRLVHINTELARYRPDGENRIVAAQDARDFLRSEGWRAVSAKMANEYVSAEDALKTVKRAADFEEALEAAASIRAIQRLDAAFSAVISEGKQ